MERSKVAWVTVVVLLLLAGCSEPTLKSDDFDGSAKRVRESVAEEQRPVRVQVTGEARKLLPAPSDYEALVAKKPTAEELARAQAGIDKAEQELADVERRLREVG